MGGIYLADLPEEKSKTYVIEHSGYPGMFLHNFEAGPGESYTVINWKAGEKGAVTFDKRVDIDKFYVTYLRGRDITIIATKSPGVSVEWLI